MSSNKKSFDFPSYLKDENVFLRKLYGTPIGRMALQPMCTRGFSVLIGKFMDSSLSTRLIPYFVKKYAIPLSEYQFEVYHSFNEFFKRNIRAEFRPVDKTAKHLIAPCDSKLSVYPITNDSLFTIKETPYSVKTLLKSSKLANQYNGGYCFIFRLSVDDYHHYCFPDDGCRTRYVHIPGVFHTVNPLVLEYQNIYKENTREYAVLRTKNFGEMIMMQVGAMLVGKISNRADTVRFRRGEEAGVFEYGGSTVVLLTKPNTVIPHQEIIERSRSSYETVVKLGECVAIAADKEKSQ